jgi:hypothetical protein
MKRTNDKNQPSENSILEAMQQNWLHARHLENQRLTFTNLYAAIVAAVLAFMGQNGIDKNVYLVWFLLIFSIFGLMVVLKTNHEYGHHMQSVQKSAGMLRLGDESGFPTAYRKGKSIWKIIRVRYAFLGFYILTSFMWIYLLLTR